MSNNTKRVPAAALHCVVGGFELGDNGEESKTAPFKMVARTGDAIDHWFWGQVVHDLDGMKLSGSKVAIDYVHDDNQIIGYANRFSAESGDLEVSGALTPYKEQDRASEIIHKSKMGVPYQASINFAGDGIKIEEFRQGEHVQVNGRRFSGPVTVIREWPLRGVAVCPYGADGNTLTEFSETNSKEVQIMSHESEKELTAAVVADEVEATETVADDAAAVDSETDNDNAEDASEESQAVETAEQVDATPAEAAALKSGQDYLERFGDQGGVWFAQGKTWDECLELNERALRDEVESLKSKLSTRQDGEDSPVEFSASDEEKPKRLGLENKIKQMMGNR